MKRVVILSHNGGRLANQLWNFVSIYAYCLEKNYECKNFCFFEFSQYFPKELGAPNLSLLFLASFFKHIKLIFGARVARKIVRSIYSVYVKCVMYINRDLIVNSDNFNDNENNFFQLAPSKQSAESLKNWEDDYTAKQIYFIGWRFRNTAGLIKFHQKITEAFRPNMAYSAEVANFIVRVRKPGVRLVGVHVRHGDYKTWNNGKYYFSFKEVRTILDDYLKFEKEKNVLFVICSDDEIDESCFHGLNFAKGPGSEIADLYVLSATDLIIGSKSTYGTFAAYYGNKPFYTFSHGGINWQRSDDIYLI